MRKGATCYSAIGQACLPDYLKCVGIGSDPVGTKHRWKGKCAAPLDFGDPCDPDLEIFPSLSSDEGGPCRAGLACSTEERRCVRWEPRDIICWFP